mmetsp:Transcript_11684/g.13880  ORF Transcript_11684/g.13880 Transcript_11684/m.13880 type:complete len:234 (-) Transcript_11684:152-853(-)|eukprot:CAMPEP_0197854338 /NCGR_PEP_ID=MMETSP1438-20131217/24491_1 /TAXON_ID=1461541 /ORGANISM="Pterosperma sp., Strain CCMP1384" /LENGTH=233 /DNA_ID=CAMNT_0043469043 /DNA_START=90 /DNA_END=791 /DNA_ORIENTATION=-
MMYNQEAAKDELVLWERIEAGVLMGFNLASGAGPLCDESMWGVAFHVEANINHTEGGPSEGQDVLSIEAQIINTAKEGFRGAVLANNSARLVEAFYLCETTANAEWIGRAYAVLGRRRARILSEEMREGSALYTVHAHLPAAESFGLADELRRETSGAASAVLVLSHWERMTEDPYYTPVTEEDREEFGEGIDAVPQNYARKCMDSVRRRKGLYVEEKLVESGAKQRTRARKK